MVTIPLGEPKNFRAKDSPKKKPPGRWLPSCLAPGGKCAGPRPKRQRAGLCEPGGGRWEAGAARGQPPKSQACREVPTLPRAPCIFKFITGREAAKVRAMPAEAARRLVGLGRGPSAWCLAPSGGVVTSWTAPGSQGPAPWFCRGPIYVWRPRARAWRG
ncbi:unnamed protein product [Amoebophrya sp. A120]|nr:unnamed protein product [Amoebophrya sp. A120]|eukprot:GSA120T00000202001.1